MKKMCLTMIALVMCFGILTSSQGYVKAEEIQVPESKITLEQSSLLMVLGQAKREVMPDTATLSVSIETLGAEMKVVKDTNFDSLSLLISALKNQNISEEDIRTENFHCYPNYDYSMGRNLKGYTATTTLNVKLNNLDNISNIISIVSESGNAFVNHIMYEISNRETVYNELLKEAFENAKQKAKTLLGDDSFEVVKIKEESVYSSMKYMSNLLDSKENSFNTPKVCVEAKINVVMKKI